MLKLLPKKSRNLRPVLRIPKERANKDLGNHP